MSSSWQGRTRGGNFGQRFFIFLIKNLGISFAYFFVNFIVLYFMAFSREGYKATFHYFHKILNYSKFKSFRWVYKNHFMFGKILIDKFVVFLNAGVKFTYEFEGEKNLADLIDKGEGGILMGAHVGNFEIAGYLLNRMDTKMNFLLYAGEEERIKKFRESVLTSKNVNIIPICDDFSHIFEVSNALKNKEIVCFAADRYISGNKLVECNFLGKSAYFPAGAFHLASKFHVPVIAVFSMKAGNNHYHLFASEAVKMERSGKKEIQDERIKQMVLLFVRSLENVLKKYPEQWFNYYNFWEKPKS